MWKKHDLCVSKEGVCIKNYTLLGTTLKHSGTKHEYYALLYMECILDLMLSL